MINNTLVYRHRRLDTNQIFYIGIGNEKRPSSKFRRNNYWKNIVNKTEYNIEIIAKNLSWEDAIELEMFLIELYGRRDNKTGILCNMTDEVTEEVAQLAARHGGLAPLPFITGDDLIHHGLRAGPAFKAILDQTYDAQMEGRVADRAAALQFALSLARSNP